MPQKKKIVKKNRIFSDFECSDILYFITHCNLVYASISERKETAGLLQRVFHVICIFKETEERNEIISDFECSGILNFMALASGVCSVRQAVGLSQGRLHVIGIFKETEEITRKFQETRTEIFPGRQTQNTNVPVYLQTLIQEKAEPLPAYTNKKMKTLAQQPGNYLPCATTKKRR